MIFTAGIILVALALLITRDACRWMGKRLEIWLARGSEQVEGHAFDASVVAPRINAVRRDYLAEVQAHEHDRKYHDELFAAARRTVRRFSFFAGRDENHHDQNLPGDDREVVQADA